MVTISQLSQLCLNCHPLEGAHVGGCVATFVERFMLELIDGSRQTKPLYASFQVLETQPKRDGSAIGPPTLSTPCTRTRAQGLYRSDVSEII